MLGDGRAGLILDAYQVGVGMYVRDLLRAGGVRWSDEALGDVWLTLLWEAVESWNREKRARNSLILSSS